MSIVQSQTPAPILLLTGPTWPSLNFVKPAVSINPALADIPPPIVDVDDPQKFTIAGQDIYTSQAQNGEKEASDGGGEGRKGLTHEVKTAFSVWDCVSFVIILSLIMTRNRFRL